MLSRSTLAAGARRNRKKILVVLVILAVFGLVLGEVVDQVGNSSGPAGRREAATWSTAIATITAQSSSLGGELSVLESSPGSLNETTLRATISTLDSLSASDASSELNLGIAPPSLALSSLASQVVNDRHAAVTDIGRSVALATNPSESTTSATNSCIAAGVLISSSDTAYKQLGRALRKTPGSVKLDGATWSSLAPALGPSSCQSLVSKLRSNHALSAAGTLHLVAVSVDPNPVQITGVPNPTTTTTTTSTTTTTLPGSTGPSGATGLSTLQPTGATGVVSGVTGDTGATGITVYRSSTTTSTTTTTVPVTTTTLQIPPSGSHSVLPPTSSLHVEVVVADEGDQPLDDVTLVAQLLGSAGKPSPSAQVSIANLNAGSSVYRSLGPLSLTGLGSSFTLRVVASSPGATSATAKVAFCVGSCK